MLAKNNIKKVNKIIKIIREINKQLLCARDIKSLCKNICKTLVKIEEYKLVWIGLIKDCDVNLKSLKDLIEEKEINEINLQVISAVGDFNNDLINEIISSVKKYNYKDFKISDSFNLNKYILIKDFYNEDLDISWKDKALKSGFLSSVILPIRFYKHSIGLFQIFSNVINNFNKEEIRFLIEVSSDISIGIRNLINEKKIIEQKNEYQELFNKISTCVAIYEPVDTDKDFIIKDFNNCAQKVEKVKKKNIVGKSVLEVFSGIKTFGLFEVFQRVSKTGKPEYFPAKIYKDNRIEGWRENYVYRLPNGDIVAVYKDLTREKKFQEYLKKSNLKLKKILNNVINILALIVEMKDPYTFGHQKRVAKLSIAIAKELKLNSKTIEAIEWSALIHDIGKISVPQSIISKTSKLTEIEFSLIKEHCKSAYEIISRVDFDYPIAKIVLQHHENEDGSGYPYGLKSHEIMIEAKILGVADVVESMVSHRPYRPALGIDLALKELEKNKGKLYDEKVVDACLILFKEKGFSF